MNILSSIIREENSKFAQHPFFLTPIDPNKPIKESLSFLPRIAFFIMSFGDLNKFIFPFENPQDDLEIAINDHALEDSNHWPWYLEDLQTLGMNNRQSLAGTLAWLWSPQMEANRKLTYGIIEMVTGQPAKIRLAIIEAIEASGRIFFLYLNRIAQYSPVELTYCGELHLSHESGHTMGSEAELIDTIYYSEDEHKIAVKFIKRTFMLLHRFIDEANQ